MEVVDAPAGRPDERVNHPDDATPDAHQPSVLRTVAAAVLALALVASLVWLAFEIRGHFGADDDGEAQGDRDAVMLVAQEYMAEAWNYGPADLDKDNKLTAYKDRVTPLLTTSFRTSQFDAVYAFAQKAVRQQDLSLGTAVERVGVSSLDADSATVILGGTRTVSTSDQGTATQPIVVAVELQRVDGQWLVDNYTDELVAER